MLSKRFVRYTGQFICGNKHCDAKEDLKSYEVDFCYSEAGETKNALVKLRLCPDCAYKLNYKKEKQKKKEEKKRKRKAEKEERKLRKRLRKEGREDELEELERRKRQEEEEREERERAERELKETAEKEAEAAKNVWRKDTAQVEQSKNRSDEFEGIASPASHATGSEPELISRFFYLLAQTISEGSSHETTSEGDVLHHSRNNIVASIACPNSLTRSTEAI